MNLSQVLADIKWNIMISKNLSKYITIYSENQLWDKLYPTEQYLNLCKLIFCNPHC